MAKLPGKRVAIRPSLKQGEEGMLMFDQSEGVWLCFRDGWQGAGPTTAPSGGNVIDVEARNALAQLVENLQTLGLIPSPAA